MYSGKLLQQQAFYISRLRYGVNLYNTNGALISLKQLCRKKGIIDQELATGRNETKIKAAYCNDFLYRSKQLLKKSGKQKLMRDKRLNHSRDYYLWLRYNVFITNVEDTFTAEQISEVYKVRWQKIEIIFKSWKSGFGLQKLLRV